MWPNSQFPSDLVTFIEESLNRKLHFLRSEGLSSDQGDLNLHMKFAKYFFFFKFLTFI